MQCWMVEAMWLQEVAEVMQCQRVAEVKVRGTHHQVEVVMRVVEGRQQEEVVTWY